MYAGPETDPSLQYCLGTKAVAERRGLRPAGKIAPSVRRPARVRAFINGRGLNERSRVACADRH